MAIPRVFISSTFYDLRYIRENLKYLVKTIGYEPILSEEGSIFFDPKLNTLDACLAEVPNCQLFILIIGGRGGAAYKETGQSITNVEYREAIRLRIPVFALIENATYHDYFLYLKNKTNPDINPEKIAYPSADNSAIFEFIHEVRSHSANNALVPFQDFADIEVYLRQQWAGMMYTFLAMQNEQARVFDMLSTLSEMNARIEMLSKQILKSVGTENAKIDAALYEEMIASQITSDLSFWKLKPTPISIFVNGSFRACAKSLGLEIEIDEDDPEDPDESYSISSGGGISRSRFNHNSNLYKLLRQRLTEILTDHGLTPEQYLQSTK